MVTHICKSILAAGLLLPTLLFAQQNRIESEFKLSVPSGQEDKIWSFLQDELAGSRLASLDSAFTSSTSRELFHDLYFDDAAGTLAEHQAGVRLRERYVADTLDKRLLQLKLPTGDSTGVARREVKFKPYERVSLNDRQAMHPFWRFVKPRDRDEVNLYLGSLQLIGDDLAPELKLEQDRRRVYVSRYGQPFLTATLDRVRYAYFPYPAFTELELELNEILYTQADSTQRAAMEAINRQLRDQLFAAFPGLEQDQTPKYNKMRRLITSNLMVRLSQNVMYIILGLLVLTAIVLFLRNR